MISKIDICSTATFGNVSQSLDGLQKFNFLFGANGTGKTTISKILADQSQFPNCSVIWENNLTLETRVYNRDFVDRNFNPQSKLKGVFTLGEQEAGTLQRIETTKQEIDALTESIKQLTNTLQGDDGNGGKRGELSQLETNTEALLSITELERKAEKVFASTLRQLKTLTLSESTE